MQNETLTCLDTRSVKTHWIPLIVSSQGPLYQQQIPIICVGLGVDRRTPGMDAATSHAKAAELMMGGQGKGVVEVCIECSAKNG